MNMLTRAAALACLWTVSGAVPAHAQGHDPFDPLEMFLAMPATVDRQSPDVAFTAGPGHLLFVRQSGVTLFRKATALEPARQIDVRTGGDFFLTVRQPGDRLTDPFAAYDADAGRFWVVMASTNPPGAILLAVSKSPNPETLSDADWLIYRLPRNEEVEEGDFDKLAFTADRVLISWQRTARPPSGPVGAGTRIRIFDKLALMNGVVPDPSGDLVLPADVNYRARPAAMASPRDRQVESDRLFYDIYRGCGADGHYSWLLGAVVNIETSPQLQTRQFASPLPCGNTANFAPQIGGPSVALKHLTATPVYYDGRLWIFEPDGADSNSPPGISWMELDVRGWPDDVHVLQWGTYRDGDGWLYLPEPAIDLAGNVAFSFVRASTTGYLSMYYAGRLATDPPFTMRPPRLLQSGTQRWTSTNLFFDMSQSAVDPIDGSIWIVGLVPTITPNGEGSDLWAARLRPADSTP